MTPADAIAVLARQLREHGQDITLQRLSTGTTPQTVLASVMIRALVRPVGKASELVGSMAQADVIATFAPSEIIAAGWASGAQGAADQRIPVKGNRIVLQDRTRSIDTVRPIYLAGQLVRIEAIARG